MSRRTYASDRLAKVLQDVRDEQERERLNILRVGRIPHGSDAEKVNLDIDAAEARITLDLPIERK